MPRTYALDATPMLGRRTGIGRYVEELVGAVAPLLELDERVVLFAGTGRLNPLFGVSHEPLRRAAEHPRVDFRRLWLPYRLLEPLWRHVGVPAGDRIVRGASVFHGTNYRLAPLRRAAGVVTIHDLSVLRFPGTVPRSFHAWFENAVRDAAARARRIVADSHATRDDIVELLQVDPARIVVVPLAASRDYRDDGDPERDARRLAEHGIRAPYVLYVGSLHPRKNLDRLLAAFARARRECDAPHRLVLVGDAAFGGGDVVSRVAERGLDGVVVLPGYLPEDDLPALYRQATLLAFPSTYEGFGLPVLEAMASGCPVLTSDVSSLPEVAGDAAELVDPDSVDAIASGLVRLLTDDARRAECRRRGRAQAARFSWRRAAEAHLDLYRELSRTRSSVSS